MASTQNAYAYNSTYGTFEFELKIPGGHTEDPAVNVDIFAQKNTPIPVVVARIAISEGPRSETNIVAVDELGPKFFPEKGRRVWLSSSSQLRLDVCENVSDLPKCSGSHQHLLGLGHSVTRDDIEDVRIYTNGVNSAAGTVTVSVQISFRTSESRAEPSLLGEDAAIGLYTERHYFLNNSAGESISALAGSLEALSSNDVLGYFGLYQKYDTPLKQRVFKRSEEYKDLRKMLAGIRKAIVNGPRFCHPVRLSAYDLKRKGFRIEEGIRSQTLTLDAQHLGRNTSRDLKGLRDFIKTDESLGLAIESASEVAMCFKILQLKPKTRKHRYRPDRSIMQFFTPAQRAFIRKNPLETVFREYRVETTHFVIGSIDAPTRVLTVKKGRILP